MHLLSLNFIQNNNNNKTKKVVANSEKNLQTIIQGLTASKQTA